MGGVRPFQDRQEAGRFLAGRLKKYEGKKNTVVLGLPRGGVVVAYEVAQALGLPLDVFIVRKLGLLGHEELAMGAIATGGSCVINDDIVRQAGVTPKELNEVIQHETAELHRRERLYRENEPLKVKDKTVLLVDDGLATGSTMRAAVLALKKIGVRKIVVAVPVGSSDTCSAFEDEADEVLCGMMPDPFYAVGVWYQDFRQTTDEEVKELLQQKVLH